MSRAIHKMRGAISFALVDTDITQNQTDSPSFANLTAGAPAVDRVLIAVITCFDPSIGDITFWPSTCTIGGVSASRRVFMDTDTGGDSVGAAIYSAVVPNGATVDVDITITFDTVMDDWALALFRATGVNVVPVDTDLTTAGTVTLDTSSAKFVLLGTSDDDFGATILSGGGNPTVAVVLDFMLIGFDDAPLGGVADDYDLDAGGTEAFVGAAFG